MICFNQSVVSDLFYTLPPSVFLVICAFVGIERISLRTQKVSLVKLLAR